ncbi:MAG: hypothetical protein ACUVSK_08270, partial [Desulfotomaculales bacterium]
MQMVFSSPSVKSKELFRCRTRFSTSSAPRAGCLLITSHSPGAGFPGLRRISSKYLTFYNYKRLHQALAYRT